MDPAGATQTTELSNPILRQPRGFETTLGSNLNLLLSQVRTFYGEGQGFTTQNFPNPRAYIHDISLRTHIQIRNPNLLDIFFGTQGQPPAPLLPDNPALPKYDITLRTFLQDTKLNLLNLDTMFAAAGQVPAYDWQCPVLTKFPFALHGFTQDLKQNLLGQDTMLGLPGVSVENIQFVLLTAPSYLYYGIGLIITEPSLVLPTAPIIVVKTQFINEFDLGNALINRILELRRKL